LNTTSISLHCRASGIGPAVVCLHSSGGSSAQWQPLLERAARQFRIVAADFHGHGGTLAPAADAPYSLATESEALARTLAGLPGPLHLVGHSYGAAVALDFACRYPRRVRALTLYEPVLFSLLEPHSALAREVKDVGRTIGELVAAGAPETAAQRFVDYWTGEGAWARMAAGQHAAVARRIAVVARHFDALIEQPVDTGAMGNLNVPITLLSGQDTRPVATAITARLATLLPGASWAKIPGAGHLGPITHAQAVNDVIAQDLTEHAFARTSLEPWIKAA
jgi:pimeloyl-ACP methyl ester carboxylesterase